MECALRGCSVMNRLKVTAVCNGLVWLLACLYTFVPYSRSIYLGGKKEAFCKSAWDSKELPWVACSPSGRLAEIAFWAALVTVLITAIVFVLERKWSSTN